MTSMVQAEMINSTGIYVVGQLAPEGDSSTDHEKRLSLDNVVSLTVPPKDTGDGLQGKTYSLDELKDLQSKLMLIAGKAEKGKDEVERFVKVSKTPCFSKNRSWKSNTGCFFFYPEKDYDLLFSLQFNM